MPQIFSCCNERLVADLKYQIFLKILLKIKTLHRMSFEIKLLAARHQPK